MHAGTGRDVYEGGGKFYGGSENARTYKRQSSGVSDI